MNILGQINCPNCNVETRFLIEDETEELLLIGDKVEGNIEDEIMCEYCYKQVKVYGIEKDGLLAKFLNESEKTKFDLGNLQINKVVKGKGLEDEKNKKIKQFDRNITIDFETMPLKLNDKIQIEKKNWEVIDSYKKEYISKDSEERIENSYSDEYWFQIKNGEETKWLIVLQIEKNNAFITQSRPIFNDKEQLFNINDIEITDNIIMEKQLNENFMLEVYQKLSGINVILYTLNENGEKSDVEYDSYGETFEEAVKEIEELYSINV